VRNTSVFVRLLEKSEENFDDHEYLVFGGTVNQARLEENYAKLIKKYETADDKMKSIMLGETPADRSAALQKEIAWHEIYGALRYFILSNDPVARYNANFFKEEQARFTFAFNTLDEQAKKVGAVWNESYSRYEAPESSTEEVKTQTKAQLSVGNFGFRNAAEFLQKDAILGTLNDALNTGKG
jgi:hypothetical protein